MRLYEIVNLPLLYHYCSVETALAILTSDMFRPGQVANIYKGQKCISFTRDRKWKWFKSYVLFEMNRHNLRSAGYKIIPFSDRYEQASDKNNPNLYFTNHVGDRSIRYESEEMIPGIIKNLKPLINKIIIIKDLNQDTYPEEKEKEINLLINYCQEQNIPYEVIER